MLKKSVVWDTVLNNKEVRSPFPAHVKGSSKKRHMKFDEQVGLDDSSMTLVKI